MIPVIVQVSGSYAFVFEGEYPFAYEIFALLLSGYFWGESTNKLFSLNYDRSMGFREIR